ncbi:MAG: hypothetical protein E7104_01620 [Prevotella sp.]|nr:hypothetical protein [Prevotella sp.]
MRNVMKDIKIFFLLVVVLLVSSCKETPTDITNVDKLPAIFPDYIGVTVPVGIAPLNFNMRGEVEAVDVIAKGSKAGEINAQGDWADFDIDEWHQLTEQNKGGYITLSVRTKENGCWKQYRDFKIFVSRYSLDDWGLTYRRIPPGYEVGGDLGIYQRDLSNFDEFCIIRESAVPGNCINCHTANRTNPKELTMQMRGQDHGGTLIMKDGKQRWIDTKTDSTRAAGSYAYWHPDGRYVAYSANDVRQSFFVGKHQPIEVFHNFSSIFVYDTKTNKVILDKRLNNPESLPIFPAFSADGKTLYYSTSKTCIMPNDYLKVKCSIVAIPFDAKTGTFGEHTDTLLNGPQNNMSYVLARPSYDGRWLMYCRCSRSNFPVAQPDADLWMLDLHTRKTWALAAVNSSTSESYHNWSSNSRWFVFSSKREDGMYTRLYLSCVDDKGNATKPFLLPQRNPWKFYHDLFDAYNVPDFTKTKVEFDAHEAHNQLWNGEREKVKMKANIGH